MSVGTWGKLSFDTVLLGWCLKSLDALVRIKKKGTVEANVQEFHKCFSYKRVIKFSWGDIMTEVNLDSV